MRRVAGTRCPLSTGCALAALWCLCACELYDERLLEGSPPPPAERDAGMDGSPPPMDAEPTDADPESDGGPPDATPPDADTDPALDGEVTPDDDGGAEPDAGPLCGPAGIDCCPDDPSKTAPGVCGCGTSDLDDDGDGTPNCVDLCPADPDKTAPEACGCGMTEARAADCTALVAGLRHRYRFDGSGTTAFDSVAGADGMVVGTSLGGDSSLTLAGTTSGEHVVLPNDIISALSDATFEMWVSWQGGDDWQRLLDFGQSSTTGYVYLTPQSVNGVLRASFSTAGSGSETIVAAASPLDTGVKRHVALVLDDQTSMTLYVDAVEVGSVAWTGSLSSLMDVNNFLGRSQYMNDPGLSATLHEFRIYGAALTESQLATSFAADTDPGFLEPSL